MARKPKKWLLQLSPDPCYPYRVVDADGYEYAACQEPTDAVRIVKDHNRTLLASKRRRK